MPPLTTVVNNVNCATLMSGVVEDGPLFGFLEVLVTEGKAGGEGEPRNNNDVTAAIHS